MTTKNSLTPLFCTVSDYTTEQTCMKTLAIKCGGRLDAFARQSKMFRRNGGRYEQYSGQGLNDPTNAAPRSQTPCKPINCHRSRWCCHLRDSPILDWPCFPL